MLTTLGNAAASMRWHGAEGFHVGSRVGAGSAWVILGIVITGVLIWALSRSTTKHLQQGPSE